MSVPLLKNQVAVVTGSSRGIGAAIATQLAQAGCDLVIHGRAESPALESVRTRIEALQRRCAILVADFSEPIDAHAFCDQAWSAFGRVDHWINNAGADVLTTEWRQAEFRDRLNHLLQTDLTATCLLSREAGRRMAEYARQESKQGVPSIVNVGWDQACQGMAGDSGEMFAAVKGGVMAFTRSLAKSLAPDVRVNCVAPGWIRTAWGEQASDEWQRRAVCESLVKRWGTPQDVALATEFLCRHSFVNGHVLPVNGGFDHAGIAAPKLDSDSKSRTDFDSSSDSDSVFKSDFNPRRTE